MNQTKQQDMADIVALAKKRLSALLTTLSGYDEICECDNQEIADANHDYGEENEICLNCGGQISMC